MTIHDTGYWLVNMDLYAGVFIFSIKKKTHISKIRVVTWFDGDLLFTTVEKQRITLQQILCLRSQDSQETRGDLGGPKGPQSQPWLAT